MKLNLAVSVLLSQAFVAAAAGDNQSGRFLRPNQNATRAIAYDNDGQEIVGGDQSDVGEFPYYVDMFGCGGSLIAPDVVLSAAHCGSYKGWTVIVGGYKTGTTQHGAVERTVVKEILHSKYDDESMVFDFSLYKLNKPVTQTTPIELDLNSDSTKPTHGQPLTVLGLGTLSSGGSSPTFLRDVVVNAVQTSDCNDEDAYDGEVDGATMLCASKPGKDSCQGDSGGPIVIRDGNKHTQVGVVSWGYGCADPDYPGVYSRVSRVHAWIKSNVCTTWNSQASFCDGSTPPSTDLVNLRMDLRTDRSPKQVNFVLKTQDGKVVWKKKRLRKKNRNHVYTASLDRSGCATLTIRDRGRNGLTGKGKVKLTYDGSVVYNSGKYGARKTFRFGDGC